MNPRMGVDLVTGISGELQLRPESSSTLAAGNALQYLTLRPLLTRTQGIRYSENASIFPMFKTTTIAYALAAQEKKKQLLSAAWRQ